MINKVKIQLFLWILLGGFGIISQGFGAESNTQSVYDAKGKRDPFTPLVAVMSHSSASSGLASVESIEDLKIEGVVFDPAHGSIVMVNGSVLREGEESGNVKVVKVLSDGATFLINGVEAYKPTYQEKKETKRENVE